MANVIALLTKELLELKTTHTEVYSREKELEVMYSRSYPRDPNILKSLGDAGNRAIALEKKMEILKIVIEDIQHLDVSFAIQRRLPATIVWARLRSKP